MRKRLISWFVAASIAASMLGLSAAPAAARSYPAGVDTFTAKTARSELIKPSYTRIYDISQYPAYTPLKSAAKCFTASTADGSTDYGYSQLSDSQQHVYLLIKQAAKAKAVGKETNISSYHLSIDDLAEAYYWFYDDNPQYFWLKDSFGYYGDDSDVESIVLETLYGVNGSNKKLDIKTVNAMQSQINGSVKVYLNAVKGIKGQYDKELALHDMLAMNISYDKTDADSFKVYNHTITGPFIKKIAVCEGYARAYQYLLNLCGIESVYVSDDDHAWNKVLVDGQWYNVDVTWDDTGSSGVPMLCHEYFNSTDADIALDHGDFSPQPELYVTPECTADTDNFFKHEGRYYTSTDNFEQTVVQNIVSSIKKGNYVVDIKAADSTVYQNIQDLLVDEDGYKTDTALQLIQDVAAGLDSSLKTDSHPHLYPEDDTNVYTFRFCHTTGSGSSLVDKTQLVQEIMYAKKYYGSSAGFSAASYNSFKAALANAQKVSGNAKAAQKDADSATAKLAKAINSLAPSVKSAKAAVPELAAA